MQTLDRNAQGLHRGSAPNTTGSVRGPLMCGSLSSAPGVSTTPTSDHGPHVVHPFTTHIRVQVQQLCQRCRLRLTWFIEVDRTASGGCCFRRNAPTQNLSGSFWLKGQDPVMTAPFTGGERLGVSQLIRQSQPLMVTTLS